MHQASNIPHAARQVRLSKFLLLILRHQPERFGLALDEEGWASLAEVMEILRGLPNFRWATCADVMSVVGKARSNHTGDPPGSPQPPQFEVRGGRIRARRRKRPRAEQEGAP